MSNWLHVAAIVRIDAFEGFFEEDDFHAKETNRITEVFGKELRYDDDKSWKEYREHPERYLPAGSEGSLKMSLWTNPKNNYCDRYTLSIFGDLRDRFDGQSIVDWFKDRCSKMERWTIRNACITVTNEVSTYASSTTEQCDGNELDADNSNIVWLDMNDERKQAYDNNQTM